jgi:predicted RNase H-like HicB family nuclease
MRIRVIVHKADEGGFWAEVPSIPGCATQGETMEEIEANVREAIEGCLSVEVEQPLLQMDDQVIELAL